MKHLIVSLFSACLITSYCSAQVPPGEEPGGKSTTTTHTHSHTETPAKGIAVEFIPTDTCYLSISKIGGGKTGSGQIINKNSPTTIQLSSGNYSLLFESLETGKIIKDRSFRLTKDSVKGGKYSYPV